MHFYPEQYIFAVLLALFACARAYFPNKSQVDAIGAVLGLILLLGYAAYGVAHIFPG